MGKWDQLEKEFDEILNSMTQEDWERWDKEREQNAANRRREMDMAAAQLFSKGMLFDIPKTLIVDYGDGSVLHPDIEKHIVRPAKTGVPEIYIGNYPSLELTIGAVLHTDTFRTRHLNFYAGEEEMTAILEGAITFRQFVEKQSSVFIADSFQFPKKFHLTYSVPVADIPEEIIERL